jgi:hypothetical protein
MRNERSGEPIKRQGEQLREHVEIERTRAGGVHHWRCSDGLREQIVRFAVTCSAEGESHRRIAGRLGLEQGTVSRWIRESAGSNDFRQVAIVPSTGGRASEPAAEPAALRVITPHGFIVEGLDLEHLAGLLRVLG